ncbi:hypothetical protein Tco_0568703 [Tanacetum coccineum]
MDSQFISLKEELQDMRNKYYDLKDNHASKNSMNDDMPMCERHEVNSIQSGAGMKVDIGLDEGHDKKLRPADMLLYSWDGGLEISVDLTGSSPT